MRVGRWLSSWSSFAAWAALIVGACSSSSTPDAKHSRVSGADAGAGTAGTAGLTTGGNVGEGGSSSGGTVNRGGVGGTDGGMSGEATGGGSGAGGGDCTPTVPSAVTANPGDTEIEVRWTPASSNCGYPITSYVVTQTPNDTSETAEPSATSITMTGLTNGTPYTFTVAATNAAGIGTAESVTATPTAAPNLPAFPLVTSSNGRYLQDQNGRPFRVQGDTAWDASVSVTLSELRTYLDDRRAKGFNTILVEITNPSRYAVGSTAPRSKGASGALPFLRNASGGTWDGDPGFANVIVGGGGTPHYDADFSSPNPAYFAWIDTLLNEARSRGILVFLTSHYIGYNNGAQDGWWLTMGNAVNTQAVCFGYGQFLGNRYKTFGNIVWEVGVDTYPAVGAEITLRLHKILEGIQAAGDTHPWTGHWVHDYLATDHPSFVSDIDVQGSYTHGVYPSLGPTYPQMRLGYARNPPLPTVLLETTYEGEHGVTAVQMRGMMWGAVLGGVGGVIFGNMPVWNFDSGWPAALNSVGARDMQRMGALFDSMPWHELVPSGLAGMKTLITAGTGTAATYTQGVGVTATDNWVVSAATTDGRYLVAYVPGTHTGSLTVDMTALSGSARARWFDPTNSAFSAIGTFPNTGTQAFTPPGNNSAGATDWVLFVDRS